MEGFLESLSKMLEIEVASIPFAVALIATVIAGIMDARHFSIPNGLTLGLIVSGLLFHFVMPEGQMPEGHGWPFSVAGLGFGLMILLPFFLLGGVGAGDVKLLAGIGAWVGIHDVMAIFLVFGFLTGVYATLLLLFRGEGRKLVTWPTHQASAQRIEEVLGQDPSERKRLVIPMAPAMAIAILILALT